VQDVLIVYVENLGDQSGTHRVRFTGIAIDYHSHGRLRSPNLTFPAQYSHELGRQQLCTR
jgi:hypothetical protein